MYFLCGLRLWSFKYVEQNKIARSFHEKERSKGYDGYKGNPEVYTANHISLSLLIRKQMQEKPRKISERSNMLRWTINSRKTLIFSFCSFAAGTTIYHGTYASSWRISWGNSGLMTWGIPTLGRGAPGATRISEDWRRVWLQRRWAQ